MKVHALSLGTVELKTAFLHATRGRRGRANLLLPGQWVGPMPIHAWLVEHDGQRILVDTGETAKVKNLPFVRFRVTEADELPHALSRSGLTVDDLDLVVLTHMHSDHHNGAVHVGGPVLVGDREWRGATSRAGRLAQRVTRAPLPSGVDFRPFALNDGPFGAFAQSHRLSPDGRVVAVATPGHTPGHLSIVAVDDADRHLFLAGDMTDSLEQLRARRPDAVGPDPDVHVQTIDRVLEHGRRHPTVYLPSHDPESARRLAVGELL